MKQLLYLLIPFALRAQPTPQPTQFPDPETALQQYRNNLTLLREEHTQHRDLPDLHFFMFGMGNRTKYIYRGGRLLNALTGNIEEQWTVKKEVIVPSEYLVHLQTDTGSLVQIREDETGVWVLQHGKKARRVTGTRTLVNLPRFAEKRFGPVLRVLHQEVLINTIRGSGQLPYPVPNCLVYQKPAYPDAALSAMVLRQTGNLNIIRDWILTLRDPFNRTGPGVSEPDNIGQVLFMVSLVADKNHPAVAIALDSAGRFSKENYIEGQTDGAVHPVFQTKWLKFGLKSLGLPDSYRLPNLPDTYSSLFWEDFTNESLPDSAPGFVADKNHPAASWATEHFLIRSGKPAKTGMVGSLDYPLSWDQQDRHAHYPGLTVLDKELVKQKIAFPYTRHAAELFLLLVEQ